MLHAEVCSVHMYIVRFRAVGLYQLKSVQIYLFTSAFLGVNYFDLNIEPRVDEKSPRSTGLAEDPGDTKGLNIQVRSGCSEWRACSAPRKESRRTLYRQEHVLINRSSVHIAKD